MLGIGKRAGSGSLRLGWISSTRHLACGVFFACALLRLPPAAFTSRKNVRLEGASTTRIQPARPLGSPSTGWGDRVFRLGEAVARAAAGSRFGRGPLPSGRLDAAANERGSNVQLRQTDAGRGTGTDSIGSRGLEAVSVCRLVQWRCHRLQLPISRSDDLPQLPKHSLTSSSSHTAMIKIPTCDTTRLPAARIAAHGE